jgi:hypothetical protein
MLARFHCRDGLLSMRLIRATNDDRIQTRHAQHFLEIITVETFSNAQFVHNLKGLFSPPLMNPNYLNSLMLRKTAQ